MAPPTATTTEKKSLGRRKIEIKQLVHEGQKQVTFSKRRVGIFKKAAELAVLCDAQIAVVTFSPGDKCFCFGHPSVDAVADRFAAYLQQPAGASDRRSKLAPASLPADFPDLNHEHAEALAVLEVEKRRAAELMAGAGAAEYWWERAAGAMEAEELDIFVPALQEIKFNAHRRIESMGKSAESGDREGYFGGDWEESGGGGGGVFCNGFDFEPFWVNDGQPNN